MPADLSQLEPKLLWKHFDALRQIPRPSKKEKAASDYVVSVAEGHGFEYDRDRHHSVVVRMPATSGHKNSKTLVLQSHLDMVCEKNAHVSFDFDKDPIKLRIEDDWLYADGTTLGADNGIGVAASLSIMDDTRLAHGPIELLFTVDEETGLTGAAKLQPDFVMGRILINLDSEEEGVFSIGCAGGADTVLLFNFDQEPASNNGRAIKLIVKGLKGGHSGIDINKNRGNAIKFLTRMLLELSESISFRLYNLQGGNMHNAIPREASAELVITEEEYARAKDALNRSFAGLQKEYGLVEKSMKLQLEELSSLPQRVLKTSSHSKLLNYLYTLPNGVIKMASEIPNLVESSVNLATVRLNGHEARILMSARSSILSARNAIERQLVTLSELAGAQVKSENSYPGWTPNLESAILKVAKSSYLKLTGQSPKVEAVHAGLECGILAEKFPGMDMVSIGPQIEHPHSPDERVNIPSVGLFYKLLSMMIEEMS